MARFALDDVKIATPCDESWEDMVGDDRVRHCSGCRRSVYNLDALSRPEAQALLENLEGRACIRLYRRADGTVLTRDCPEGTWERHVQFARLRPRLTLLFGLASGTALVPLVIGKQHTPNRPVLMMGAFERVSTLPPPDPVKVETKPAQIPASTPSKPSLNPTAPWHGPFMLGESVRFPSSGKAPETEQARITGRLNEIETEQEGRVIGGLISSCNDGIDQGLDGLMDCADPGCRLLPACANTKEFKNYAEKHIPDDDVRGITRELVVNDDDDGKIRALTMQVNVQHSSPGDLSLEVEHNGVKQIVVQADRGNRFLAKAYLLDKFIGTDARGRWTLRVRDVMQGHAGRFLSWTLYVTREVK